MSNINIWLNQYYKKSKDFLLQDMDVPHTFFIGSAAFVVFLAIFFIGFIVSKSLPIIIHEGPLNFLIGTSWRLDYEKFQILAPILGTTLVTIATALIAIPVSIFSAIFLAEFSPPKLYSLVRPLIELLVGIPSVVYGILGFLILEDVFQFYIDPLISSTLGAFIPIFYDPDPLGGSSILLAATILTMMILPTIISISEDGLRSVPSKYKEASFALGATRWETIKKIKIPIALKGIVTGTELGILRAMNEATAVAMVIGHSRAIPDSILDASMTLTTQILVEAGMAPLGGLMASAFFGIAITLFIMQFIVVCIFRLIKGILYEF